MSRQPKSAISYTDACLQVSVALHCQVWKMQDQQQMEICRKKRKKHLHDQNVFWHLVILQN